MTLKEFKNKLAEATGIYFGCLNDCVDEFHTDTEAVQAICKITEYLNEADVRYKEDNYSLVSFEVYGEILTYRAEYKYTLEESINKRCTFILGLEKIQEDSTDYENFVENFESFVGSIDYDDINNNNIYKNVCHFIKAVDDVRRTLQGVMDDDAVENVVEEIFQNFDINY